MRKVMHHQAVAPGVGMTFWDGDYTLKDRERQLKLIEVTAQEAPEFSVQVEQSLDGIAWYPVGDPLTAVGLYERTIRTPYYRARVASFTGGGTLSVFTN